MPYFSSALKQALKWDMLLRNPAASVDLPRMVRKEMRAMTPEEAGRFLAAVKDTRHNALFMFALTTGCRPQEYLGMKWSDIDMDKGTATVRRAIVWNRSKVMLCSIILVRWPPLKPLNHLSIQDRYAEEHGSKVTLSPAG